MFLLQEFGYVKEKQIIVPVYSNDKQIIINELFNFTQNFIFFQIMKALNDASIYQGLSCSRTGVAMTEIANELYYILFGQINEAFS